MILKIEIDQAQLEAAAVEAKLLIDVAKKKGNEVTIKLAIGDANLIWYLLDKLGRAKEIEDAAIG